MGFKTDREFLRNVTVGAVGTRRVAEILRDGGCDIIELERYSQSNKIWATKVKRLRVPDLLCLRCGTRTESRAKSRLKIIMSYAENNPDRAWDKGLRNPDLVACIKCTVDEDMRWRAGEDLTLFTVEGLRATRHLAKTSRRKDASRGSEVHLTWPAIITNHSGGVEVVTDRNIKVRFEAGNRYTYQLVRRSDGQETQLYSHVNPGDHFCAGRVIASVIPETAPARCPVSDEQYDFFSDLVSTEREIVYGAVKALGHLPDLHSTSIDRLATVMTAHGDALVRLEAAASLARLGDERGWHAIEAATESGNNSEVRMESILILSELPAPRSVEILAEIARKPTNPSELRAAAAWGTGATALDIGNTPLLKLIADDDETTALHAIVTVASIITDEMLPGVLDEIGRDARKSAAIVKALKNACCDPIPHVLPRLENADPSTRNWLLYLLASLGRERCAAQLASQTPDLLEKLEFFWHYHNENWTNRLDIADQTDFLLGQSLN